MLNIDIKESLNSLSSFFDANHIFIILTAIAVFILFSVGLLLKRKRNKIESNRYNIYTSIYFASILLLLLSVLYVSLVLYFPTYTKYPHINKVMLLALTIILGVVSYRISILFVIDFRRVINKTLDRELDDIVFKWISIAIKAIVSISIFFIALRIYNIDITTLVAGLGIGGIAVALAAQDTMSNILGCAIIVLDKPFVIGNRIKILEYDGTIEAVGLRSIRIRTFDGSIVVVPNKTVSNSNIENVTSRTSIRQVDEINIEPSLNNSELKNLIISIKQILEEHAKVKNDYDVFFDKRNAISITLKIIYYADTTDYREYMITKEEINYLVYELLASKKIKYAYPSSIVHLGTPKD